MILTTADIQRFAFGCERLEEINGSIHFHRLPEELADNYRSSDGSRVRLECPSAVRLRFDTDAKAVRLDLRFGAAARPFFQGCLVAEARAPIPFGPDAPAADWHGEVALPGGTVELWLPHLARTDLARAELVDASFLRPAPPLRARLLVYGDSITQGMTAPLPTETWVAQCALELGLDVRNFGVGGAKMASFLADHGIDWPYDLLAVAYGTNDFNQGLSPDDYAANLHTFLCGQLEAHPGAAAVVVTPPPWVGRTTPNARGCSLGDYRAAAVAACDGLHRTHVVHGADLMPDEAALFVDNVHPNAAGMQIYARRLAPHLASLLSDANQQG